MIKGLLVGAVLFILFFLVINAIEFFSWSSTRVRLLLFVLLVLFSAFVFVFYLVIPAINLIRYRKMMTPEQAAEIIGKFFPDIQDRLTNTLQLNKLQSEDTDNSLLEAAIAQRMKKLSPFDFSEAVVFSENRSLFLGFAVTLLCFSLLIVFWPEFAVKPTERIVNYEDTFERPLPFNVVYLDSTYNVVQGDDCKISIKVTGTNIPEKFYVVIGSDTRMMKKTDVNTFAYTFHNLYSDVDFKVIGDKYVGHVKHIQVHPKPILISYDVEQLFPKYTSRKTEKMTGKTRFIVPVGTKLIFRFNTRNTDDVVMVSDSLSFSISRSSENIWCFDTIVYHNLSFNVFVNNEWYNSNEALDFVVEVVEDEFPEIQVQNFTEETSSSFYFSGMMSDDYGFTKLLFRCYSNDKQSFEVKIPIGTKQLRQTFYYSLDFDSVHGILPGDRVSMFFEVWDNDAINGPKSSRSDVFSYYKPTTGELDSLGRTYENGVIARMQSGLTEIDDLKKQIESLMREIASKKEVDWNDKEKLKEIMQELQRLQQEWNSVQEDQKSMSDFLKDNELISDDLIQKQKQINELFDEVVPDEMKKMLDELEKFSQDISRDKMKQMVEQMKQNGKKLQQLMDRNLALLEKWKLEKDIMSSIDRLNELGEQLQNADSLSTAQKAKTDFESIMHEMDSLSAKDQESGDPLGFEVGEQEKEDINQELDDAQEDEKSNDKEKSTRKLKSAGQKMQDLSVSLSEQMESDEEEQMGEDAYIVRMMLENVVRSSLNLEDIMIDIKQMKRDDPKVPDIIKQISELSENIVVIEDSLREMANRQPMIGNFVFDEIHKIDLHISNSLSSLKELHLPNSATQQQYALMSMNNLALMLAESLDQMNMGMGKSGNTSKSPNQQSAQQNSQKMQKMRDMQKQLGEKLKKMQQQKQKGNPGNRNMSESEEFARMAAEQEMIRQGMQQIMEELKESGQYGKDGFNDIIRDMNKLEEELVNKHIDRKTVERSQQIEQRLLKAENAILEREKEEKRKSSEFKGKFEKRKIDELEFEKAKKRIDDILKYHPIEYQEYYKKKINNYFMN